jgi:SnoaL-like domain
MCISLSPNIALKGISTPQWIVQSALAALSEGRISEVLDQFDDHFTFIDHALVLEFTDKGRLMEFLHKSRELSPDTVVEVVSIFECGDHAIAEWNLRRHRACPFNPPLTSAPSSKK